MKKVGKKLIALVLSLGIMGSLTGCMKPYDTPEFAEISPSETAFLIPMEGQTSEQGKFQSEDFLKSNLIAAKRIQIPHKWVQTGRRATTGKYLPTHRLVKVERKPVSREWTSDVASGTEKKNQAIRAESKESIAFSSNFNITAQIEEPNAPKFLYLYNGVQLEAIMDSEIRNRITTKWVEECSKYTLTEILANKSAIMKTLRDDVEPYFKGRGITITSIGLNGDFNYDSAEIQKSIDSTFAKAKELEAQKSENQKNIEKAEADKKVIEAQSSTLDQSIKLKQLEVQMKLAEAELEKAKAMKEWKNVTTITNGNSLLTIPAK